jgi:branched-chain amino acid transport system substrate-binding protein
MDPTTARSIRGALDRTIDRRTLLRGAGAAAVMAGGASAVGACTRGDEASSGSGTAALAPGDVRPVRIGYVSPQTEALAPFGAADIFVTTAIRNYVRDNGLTTGGGAAGLDLFIKDTKSDPKRAAAATTELINNDQVDMVLVSSTPDTTNPVADVCEAAGVPCISTVAPWQSWFFGRGASPVSTFRWTYHFFWGLEDVETVFMDMWDAVETNRTAGALWPADPDGTAWGDPATGFLPAVARRGYGIVDPGFYDNGSPDFTRQIEQFKTDGAEILVGVPIPPDFPTFWQQADTAGYRPKLATVAKALLFPQAVAGLGDRGHNLATEVWWSNTHPFTSSLTGQTAAELATAYEDFNDGQTWTQPIGLVHALFEVAAAALAQADGPDDRDGIVDALSTMSLDTVCGPLDWNAGPVPNVSKIPLVGGQWRVRDRPSPELVVVSNAQALSIPKGGEVEPLS